MKLDRAVNIDDLRAMAKARLPRMVFDYIDGGADDEVTLKHSVSRFDDYQLTGRVLRDVSKIDCSTIIMGQRTRLPFFISPTASTRLFHPAKGELAMAGAAHEKKVIYACSTLASQTVEDIAKANPGPKWVQLYVWNDKEIVKTFLKRAKAAGFTGCILTVDMPVAGNRERDPRNNFAVPPTPNAKIASQVLARPGWLWDLIRSPKITPANFNHLRGGDAGAKGGIIGFVNEQFSRSVAWEDVKWMRDFWDGGFAIKGIARAEDAMNAVSLGADAVWVSNHGGRQLDTSVPTIDLLPEIVDAASLDEAPSTDDESSAMGIQPPPASPSPKADIPELDHSEMNQPPVPVERGIVDLPVEAATASPPPLVPPAPAAARSSVADQLIREMEAARIAGQARQVPPSSGPPRRLRI